MHIFPIYFLAKSPKREKLASCQKSPSLRPRYRRKMKSAGSEDGATEMKCAVTYFLGCSVLATGGPGTLPSVLKR